MIVATFLFAAMGLCAKFAAAHYTTGEMVFYRSLFGAVLMAWLARRQGIDLRTPVAAMQFWRSLTGVASLMLWFYAIGNLPLATAMTLNYMSSIWMGVFMIGGAALLGSARIDGRLIATVLLGFCGVALILQPTIEQEQLWHGLMGLLSGVLAALAYLQVDALGRAGEPEERTVFYFSIAGLAVGALAMLGTGTRPHSPIGVGLLLAIGLLASVAQLMMTRAFRAGRALVNASLQYLGIVYAYIFGVVFFGDRMTWLALLGMALVIGAGLAATLLRKRTLPTDNAGTVTPS
jgi:drug/metabolite transporter (DMT)-like permease